MVTLLLNRLAFDPRRSGALIARNLAVQRHSWLLLVSGLAEPLFYLLSLGVGLGALIGTVPLGDGRNIRYAVFVAPAMLAVTAMNGALTETTFNIFGKLKFIRLYDAILATPLTPFEVAVGEITSALMRGGVYSGTFLVIMAMLGFVSSWWAVLALPAAILTGLAFASLGLALVTFLDSWQDFDYVNMLMVVMFMFAGTFAPVTAYPEWARWVLEVTPLYHSVVIIRGLTTGAVSLDLLGHVAYLLVATALGLTIGARRLGRLLIA